MSTTPHSANAADGKLRVMTWNVHSCIGLDRRRDEGRIARVIADLAPDVVALQELGQARGRANGDRQAQAIANTLDMDCQYYPVIDNAHGNYGIAILSRLPMHLVKAARLPGLPPRFWREPRGALWVAVTAGDREVQVLTTHLSVSPKARLLQVDSLLGKDWLADARDRGPVMLCGDFNALPGSRVCRRLRQTLDDVQHQQIGHRPHGTYPSWLPLIRLDHIHVETSILVSNFHIPKIRQTLFASDHLPLIADFGITVA